MHRDVGFLNEPKALWHAIFPEEDVLGNYTVGTARYRLDKTDASYEVKRSAHRLFGAYLALMFSERLVDKNPEMTFRVPFLREVFPNAKFVLLVRNGWDTCNSIARWSELHRVQVGDEWHDWWGLNNRKWKLMVEQLVEPDPFFSDVIGVLPELTTQRDRAVVEWIVTMREGLRWLEELPNYVQLLHYEKLLDDPRLALSDLLAFCGLAHEEEVMSYAEQVLRPSTVHSRFEIHPMLLPMFTDTLTQIGY